MSGAGVVDGKWLWIDSKTHNLPGTPRDALYPYYGKGYNTRNGNTLNFDFQLEQKLDSLVRHELYAKYKTAPTQEEREKARQEYLEKRGVPDSFRW